MKNYFMLKHFSELIGEIKFQLVSYLELFPNK